MKPGDGEFICEGCEHVLPDTVIAGQDEHGNDYCWRCVTKAKQAAAPGIPAVNQPDSGTPEVREPST